MEVKVTGTDEAKGTGMEQGGVAKGGKSAPENQTGFHSERGRQIVRTTAFHICLKVDRSKGIWAESRVD